MKTSKKLAAFLSVLFVVALVVSFCFVIAESDHDCSGEDCHVCRAINAVATVFVKFSLAVIVVLSALSLVFSAATAVSARAENAIFSTPVSLRVKLLN